MRQHPEGPPAENNKAVSEGTLNLVFLRLAIGLIFAGSLAFTIVLYLAAPDQVIRAAGPALLSLVAAIALVLLNKGRTEAAMRVLIFGMWAVVTAMSFVGGGLRTPIVIAYPAIILITGWMLGMRSAIALSTLTVLTGFGFALGELRGLLPLPPPAPPFLLWTVQAITFVIATVLIAYVLRGHEARFQKVRRLGDELAERVDALTARESQLRLITESVPAMIFHGDRELRCLYANRQFVEFFRGNAEDIAGMPLRDILGEELFQATAPRIARVLAGEKMQFQGERHSATGDICILDVSLVPDIGTDGAITGFYALKRDITEQQRAEESLRLSETRFRRLFDQVPTVAVQGYAPDGTVRYWNLASETLYGYTREEAVGRNLLDLIIPPPMKETVREAVRQMTDAGQGLPSEELQLMRKDGSLVPVFSSHVVLDNGEKGMELYCLDVDLTRHHQIEEALRETGERTARMFRLSPSPITISRLSDGCFVEVNEAFLQTYGFARDEVVGRNGVELGIWPDADARERWAGTCLQAGALRGYETELSTRDGEIRHVVLNTEQIELGGDKCLLTVIFDITERKQAEQALAAREAELQRQHALYDALLAAQSDADVGLFIIDEGKIVFANRALCNLYGYTENEIRALPNFLILAHPDDRERVLENHRRRLTGERFENRYNIGALTKSGERREVEITVGVMPSEQGTRILVIMVDISERRRAEEEMRRSEEKFSRVFRNSPLPISISRLADGRYIEVNDAFVEQFGWGKGEMVGHTSVEVGPWPNSAERKRWIDMLRKAGRVRDFEATLLTKHGNPRNVLIFAERFDLSGEDCILTMIYDDTDRERAEADLRRSEDKFSRVFQTSPIAISLARFADGTFLDINPAFIRCFGWSREELIGHTSTEVGIWPSVAERERWVVELNAAGQTRDFVVSWRNKAGETRICQISAEVVELGGEPYILAMISDVTDRMRADEALRTSQARLTEAQRIGRIGSWELDLASNYFLWSEEINRIFEATEASGQVNYETFLKNIHPDDSEHFDKTFSEAIAGGKPYDGTYRLRMRDGRIKFVHIRAETHCDEDGKPRKVVGTTQDVTEQHLAQQEIQRLNAELESRVQVRTAELMAANRELESFAYSISHDLRAPLRGIDGFSQLLIEEYRDKLDKQGQDYLGRVRRAAQRMGTLIDDILELSRVTRLEMRRVRVDLSQIARDVLEERKQSEPQSRVTWHIAPDCMAVGDPQLLRVLMQNLLENAWKYSGRAANPAIEFGREDAGGNTVFFVRDNGVGFDMQYANRLFRPFQRLHSPEEFEGTGVGLATVARVVGRHGGRVWAESAVGRGATFRFTLGRSEQTAAQ